MITIAKTRTKSRTKSRAKTIGDYLKASREWKCGRGGGASWDRVEAIEACKPGFELPNSVKCRGVAGDGVEIAEKLGFEQVEIL